MLKIARAKDDDSNQLKKLNEFTDPALVELGFTDQLDYG
jgi:hypothetical protein